MKTIYIAKDGTEFSAKHTCREYEFRNHMGDTVIISAFPGCGKTYCCEHYNDDAITPLTFIDSDSSSYEKTEGWVSRYVDDIEAQIGTVDVIFISQHDEVLMELRDRGIKFMTVFPNNIYRNDARYEYNLKCNWFGRFVLRDNSHIKDFSGWLKKLNDNWDEWTSCEHQTKYTTYALPLTHDEFIGDWIQSIVKDGVESFTDCFDMLIDKHNYF